MTAGDKHRRRGRRPRRPAHRLLTRSEHRRTGRISALRAAAARRLRCDARLRAQAHGGPFPRLTDVYRFIGPVPFPPRATGGHMGPPLRGIGKGIPFNRHWMLSKRGPPGVATPTAFVGGNPKLATFQVVKKLKSSIFSGGMYVGKNTFCFAECAAPKGPCAEQNGRKRFRKCPQTFPKSFSHVPLCRKRPKAFFDRLKRRTHCVPSVFSRRAFREMHLAARARL